jgi:hypothetical protein
VIWLPVEKLVDVAVSVLLPVNVWSPIVPLACFVTVSTPTWLTVYDPRTLLLLSLDVAVLALVVVAVTSWPVFVSRWVAVAWFVVVASEVMSPVTSLPLAVEVANADAVVVVRTTLDWFDDVPVDVEVLVDVVVAE